MTKRKVIRYFIFSRKNVEIVLGGPRTETKFVKGSASRKRLRTADLKNMLTYILSSLFDLVHESKT